MKTIFEIDPPRLVRVAELPDGATALDPELVAALEAGIAAGQILYDDGGQPALRDPRWWWSAGTGGFYREGIHALTPEDAVEISEAAHDELIAGQSEGKRIVAGPAGLPLLQDPPPVPLEEVKRRALASIDAAAETARSAFLTPGSGQALEYETTRTEAVRIIGDPEPTAEAYPMLDAERQALQAVGQTVTLAQVAETVRQESAAWSAAGAAIKVVRRTAKLQVEAAEDAEAVAAILAAIAWPNA